MPADRLECLADISLLLAALSVMFAVTLIASVISVMRRPSPVDELLQRRRFGL